MMRILLLNLPGLNLRFLGCYGNNWTDTGTLDRLATESVVFDQHYADTLGEWPSGSTGLYRFSWRCPGLPPATTDLASVLQHHRLTMQRIVAPAVVAPLDERLGQLQRTIPKAVEQLARAGNGLVWVDFPSLAPPWSVADDFLMQYFPHDVIEEALPAEHEEEVEFAEDTDENCEEPIEGTPLGDKDGPNLEQEESEVEAEAEELTSLLAPPVDVDPADGQTLERVQLTYAAVIASVDHYLGRLFDQLRQRQLFADVVLVVTADRGLSLGEHGLVGDNRLSLHEEMIHLPLLIRFPDAAFACKRISGLTQPVDLFATVLDLLNLPIPSCHSRSLLPLIRGESHQHRAYFCAGRSVGESETWALGTAAWRLLVPNSDSDGTAAREPQLYVKPDDRWEVNNLRAQHLELAEQLETTLRAIADAVHQPGSFNLPPLPVAAPEPMPPED
jgi:arylsulfatase A-like enzyme